MFAKSMLFSALLAVATTTQAAVPGEVIVAINTNAAGVGRAAVMSPDGSGKAVKVVGGTGQDWTNANWRR